MKVPEVVNRTPLQRLWRGKHWTSHVRTKELSSEELMEELNRADAIVKAAVLFPLSWEVPTHDIIDIDELIQIVKNGEYAESEDVRYNADINTAYSSLWIGEDRLVLLEISH